MKPKIQDSAFGQRMQQLKEIAGSAKRLSEMSGLSYTAIRQYLDGVADPSRSSLAALAKCTGISIQWLATGEGPMTSVESLNELRFAPVVSPEIRPVIDAVIEVMLSNDEGTKLALSQNAFTFQQSVRRRKEIDELRNDIEIIKKRLLDPQQTDFKTMGPEGGEQHLDKHRAGGE